MSRTLLLEAHPRRPADGAVVPLRLVFKGRERGNYLGVQWQPLLLQPPLFETMLGFDGQVFAADPLPQVGAFTFPLGDGLAAFGSLVWKGADLTLKQALWPQDWRSPADGDFTTIWSGKADAFSSSGGLASATILDAGQPLRAPVLVSSFGTTGNALLDGTDASDKKGAAVPMAWGKVLSIPGKLVDKTNNIWLFAGCGATSVQGFYDGGAAFTLGTARANLAALIANVPAAGAVDYALNSAGLMLARPWSAPVFPFTADMTFGSAKAADIAQAIVTGRTAVTFKAGSVAAFNTAQPADCGLYLDDATTIATALDRIFGGLGSWWKLTSAGTIDIRQWAYETPVLTVAGFRRGKPDRKSIVMPTWRRTLGYAHNNKVHAEGDIAGIVKADTVAYADGTIVQSVQPAEAGSDVTANQQIVVSTTLVQNFDADYLGNIPGSLGTVAVAVAKGGTSIKLADTTTYAATPSAGLTGAIDNTNGSATKGNWTPATFTANNASVDIVVTVAGIAQPKITIQYVKKLGDPPSTGGSTSKTVSWTSFSNVTSTSPAAIVSIGTLALAAGESLYGAASLDYDLYEYGNAARAALAKWQYAVSGSGSWTDFGSAITGTSAHGGYITGGTEPDTIDPVSGHVDVTQTKSGLSAGTYDVRLVAYESATGKTLVFSGSSSVQAKP